MQISALLLGAVLSAAPINVGQGEPAPYAGAIVDAETAETIRIKRAQCEAENASLKAAIEAKNAEIEAAPAPSGGVVYLVVFVVGMFVGGLMSAAALK